MLSRYEQYKNAVRERIVSANNEKQCLPIYFVGSGISQRYFGGPNWGDLLNTLQEICPKIENAYAYYRQDGKHSIDIGEIYADAYKEWAWGSARERFPQEYYSTNISPHIFIKYEISQYFKSITPKNLEAITSKDALDEIIAFRASSPHAIITTNYDELLERIFPDFKVVVGQQILKSNSFIVGEIFKIHGCVSDPQSLVLTRKDYVVFDKKQKYLSAKLLTYFAEHPLIFLGYSVEDPNIKIILSNLDEILSNDIGLITNIFIVKYDNNINEESYPSLEEVINIDEYKNIRINCIVANSYKWIYEAFKPSENLTRVNARLLRSVMARTHKLVREDIPKSPIGINFSLLESISEDNDSMATLYGVGFMGNATHSLAQWPYTPVLLANALGYDNWQIVNKTLVKIKSEKGIDIKETDNKYHLKIKMGRSSESIQHRYSVEAAALLKKVLDNESYEIDVI